jgi:hypothetical protein
VGPEGIGPAAPQMGSVPAAPQLGSVPAGMAVAALQVARSALKAVALAGRVPARVPQAAPKRLFRRDYRLSARFGAEASKKHAETGKLHRERRNESENGRRSPCKVAPETRLAVREPLKRAARLWPPLSMAF